MKKSEAKKFLKNYEKAHIGDINVDLKLFRERYKNEKEITIKSGYNKRPYWILASAIITIVIIAVMMPLLVHIFNVTSQEQNEEYRFYCSAEEYRNDPIDNIDNYLKQNQYNIKRINQDVFFTGYVRLSLISNDLTIGILSEVLVFEEDIVSADIIAYVDKYVIDNINFYNLNNTETVGGIEYKFSLYDEDELKYAIEFEEKGILYQITVICEHEVAISTIIERLFA